VFSVAAWFPGGATLFLPYHELHSSPSQNRTSGFPNIRRLGRSFSEPPLYDRGSGLCGFAEWANPRLLKRGETPPMYTPGAGSCG
jgi:hypothetical protein